VAIHTISLCAGYDGIGLGIGLVEPGYRTVCYVEREAFASANLAAKMGQGCLDEAPIWSDVATFDGKPWSGKVDCITAGIPCQPWSCAGQRKGTADERWIWDDIYRIIQEVRPKWCFFEEVRGFIRGGLGIVLFDMCGIGYDSAWDLFRASDVGAPHQRERLFVLCELGYTASRAGYPSRPHNRQRTPKKAGCTGERTRWAQDKELVDAERIGHLSRECKQGEGSEGGKRQEASTARRGNSVWPSRPGERQHEWEPPRVVGNAEKRENVIGEPGNMGGETCGGRSSENATDGTGYGVADTEGLRGKQPECGEPKRKRPDTTGEATMADGISGLQNRGADRTCRGFGKSGETCEAVTGAGSESDGLRQTQSALGRNADGNPDRLDLTRCTNRVDELRLCGNGVVPLVSAVAWHILTSRLRDYRGAKT